MRWVVIAGVGLAVLVGVVLLIGILTPREHTASVRVTYRAAPEVVYGHIQDVERGPEWRSGLQEVEVLSGPGEALRWRETADWGALTFVHETADAPRRIVSRIVDEGQGFGGTWSWDIAPSGSGSVVVITEHGVIDNPVYRFMSRYVMGYYESLETFARDLGRRMGEEVEAERVGGP